MKKIIFLTNLIAISAVLGMQNNFTEENHSQSKKPMKSVNANDSKMVSYESFVYQDWVSKIVRMSLNGEDFNAPQNADKQTILMCATKYANCKIMQQVLNVKDDEGNRRADINSQDMNGDTALSIAAKAGDDEKILLLLKNSADVELAKKKVSGEALTKLEKSYQQVRKATTDFVFAMNMRNISRAKSLLKNTPVDVNMSVITNPIFGTSSTALISAAHPGNEEILKLLLKYPSIDVNVRDNKGGTALSYAVRWTQGLKKEHLQKPAVMSIFDFHQKPIVELLLKHPNIDVNMEDNNKLTPLMHATLLGRTKTVELLLKHKDIEINKKGNLDCTALMMAAAFGQPEIVKLLISQPGININLKNQDGATALHQAVMNGHEDVVKLLLEHLNIDVNAKSNDGFTVLISAAGNGRKGIVKLLLKHPKINVNEQENTGFTALLNAATNGHTEIVKMLLEYPKTNVNLWEKHRYTALLNAEVNGHTRVVELLVNHPDTDINFQDDEGYTALSSAARNGRKEIVQLLLNRSDVDVNVKDNNGDTALIHAVREGHTKIVKMLLKHPKIDVNMSNKRGAIALMYAVNQGRKEIVEILLNYPKTDVNIKDEDNVSALMYAFSNLYAIINLFSEHPEVGVHTQDVNLQIIKLLLKHPEINVNTDGYGALLCAVCQNRAEVVELLLNHPRLNADVNMLNAALPYASINGYTGIVKLLLNQSGIDINGNNVDSYAVILSVVGGYEDIFRLFLEKGVDVNKKYAEKFTALMYAVEAGNARMVNFLLNQPCIDINARNTEGETALDIANRKGRRSIIRLIQSKMASQSQQFGAIKKDIKHNRIAKIKEKFTLAVSQGDINGMDSLLEEGSANSKNIVNARNKKGDTPLVIASDKGNLEAVKLLLEYGADLSLKDTNGDNALIRAAKKGHLDVVEELLFRKANINSVGQHNSTALMVAVENGHLRVVKLLIKKGAKVSVKNKYDKTALDIVNEKIEKLDKTNSNYESIKSILENLSKKSSQLFNEVKIETLLNKWEIVAEKDYEKDLKEWEKNDPTICNKIHQLIKDIEFDPFRGLGRPERLTGDLEGAYSRRITGGDRLVYEIDGDKVILKSCKGHYEKDKRNRSRTNSEK